VSDRLNKARAAFEDAVTADYESAGVPELERKGFKLLDISRTQALLSIAEDLDRFITSSAFAHSVGR
jgi:hypothetical protein